ncbi:MAG: X-domain of DnaJ-containing-domain-containing protein, partial [Olpidium bornovanus]
MIRAEAEELKSESYGVELLHSIGYTYSSKARQYLGKDVAFGVPKFFQQVREKGHIISETVSTLRSAIDLRQSFSQLQEAQKNGTLDAAGQARLEEMAAQKVGILRFQPLFWSSRVLAFSFFFRLIILLSSILTVLHHPLLLPARPALLFLPFGEQGLSAIWQTSKLDVESVLRDVCDKVLGDPDAPNDLLRRRAEGLKIIGKVRRFSVHFFFGVGPGTLSLLNAFGRLKRGLFEGERAGRRPQGLAEEEGGWFAAQREAA